MGARRMTQLLWLLAAVGSNACALAGRRSPPPPEPWSDTEELAFLADEAEAATAAAEADAVVEDNGLRDLGIDPGDFDLPVHVNERVHFWMSHFQRHSDRFALHLSRKGRYETLIRERLRARGMPEDLLYLALIESGFSPRAYSRAHAVGIWQFVAETARRYGLEVTSYLDERRDPIKSTEAALDYLQALYAQFGSWYLAAAAYNTGENRVERILREQAGGTRGHDSLFWRIDQFLPQETRNYVPRLLSALILAKYPDRFGFGQVQPQPPEAFEMVTVPDATDLEVVAQAAGVTLAEIERLNPQFPRGITPPGRAVPVRVPVGRAESFAAAFARVPPEQRLRTLEHVVRKGETLSQIALRYGTTVAAIQEANRIRDPHSITVGRRLTISRRRTGDPAAGTAAAPEPSTPLEAPPAKAGGSRSTVYEVRAGDSLWGIARKYNINVADLRRWNDLPPGGRILPGQKLLLRLETSILVYHVQPGDTLWGIARQYGTTANRLREWNRLPEDAVLRPGDRIEVPLER